MYDNFPAKNTVHTPYIPIIVWFLPTLVVCRVVGSCQVVRLGCGLCAGTCVELARTIYTVCIRYFRQREISNYTVIYGACMHTVLADPTHD